jgi:hypothetical protein
MAGTASHEFPNAPLKAVRKTHFEYNIFSQKLQSLFPAHKSAWSKGFCLKGSDCIIRIQSLPIIFTNF